MAASTDSTAGLLLKELWGSIAGIPAMTERLASALRRTARAWIVWSGRQGVAALSTMEARLPADLRQRGEQALRDLAAGRARVRTVLEAPARGFLASVADRLSLVSRQETLAIGERIAQAERRLDALAQGRAA